MKHFKNIFTSVLVAVVGLTVTIGAQELNEFKDVSLDGHTAKVRSNSKLKAKHLTMELPSIYLDIDVEGLGTVSHVGTSTTRIYQWDVTEDGVNYIFKSYYSLVGGDKWALTKNTLVGKDGSVGFGATETYYTTSSCSASAEPITEYSCIRAVSSYNEYEKYGNGKVQYSDTYTYASSAKTDNHYTTLNQKSYYITGKMSEHIFRKKNSAGNYIAGGTEKYYNTRGLLTQSYILDSSERATYADIRSYYSNNKYSSRYILKYSAGKSTSGIRAIYRSNGTMHTFRKVSYKSGKATQMYEYKYNTKGQLKSNKYGNAYRVYYGINSNKKVYKIYRAKYSSAGKLGKAYKVRTSGSVVYF